MAKTYIDTVKYLVYTEVEVDGLVEKPDVVGAIFGQTEGLLGGELDLRDLQKNGRIGRIEVELKSNHGKTVGTIKIPSSLDMVETCIIAAALETVDRVGPCEASFKIQKIEDTRNIKRKKLVERAKHLLKDLINTEIPESREIAQLVRDEVKTAEVIEYGEDRIAAGPGIYTSDEVILVEGRADVINLLKNNITNVAAIGGARITNTIVELSKSKETTVFLDGDRGGDIILHELAQGGVEIDFVARAPHGKEVEELTRKQIIKCLRSKIPFEEAYTRKIETRKPKKEKEEKVKETSKEVKVEKEDKKEEKVSTPIREIGKEDKKEEKSKRTIRRKKKLEAKKELEELSNTLKARFYDENNEQIAEVPVRDVIKMLGEKSGVKTIIFDGIITQRLADLAAKRGVKTLIGLKIGNVKKRPEELEIKVREEL